MIKRLCIGFLVLIISVNNVFSETNSNNFEIGRTLYEQRKFQQAILFFTDDLTGLSEEDISGRFHTNRFIARSYYFLDDVNKSIQISKNTLYSIRNCLDMYYAVTLHGDLGTYYLKKIQKDSAFYEFSLSYRLAKLYNLDEQCGVSAINLAAIYQFQKEYSKSNYYLNESVLLLKDEDYLQHTYLKLAGNYINLDKIDSASFFLLKAESSSYRFSSRNIANMYRMRAQCESFKNNDELALHYFDKGLRYTDSLNIPLTNLNLCINKCQFYIDRGQYKDAIDILDILVPKINVNNSLIASQCFKLAGDAYTGLDSLEIANYYLSKYLKIKDSIDNDIAQLRLLTRQIEFDVERKNNKILELNLKQESDEYESTIKSNINILLLFIILVVSVFGVIWLINNRSKQRKLKRDMEIRSNELTSYTLAIIQKNKLIEDLQVKIAKLSLLADDKTKDELNRLHQEIKLSSSIEKEWEEFEKYFRQFHPDFFNTLKERHPDLTVRNQKICALVALGYENKDLCLILNVSSEGIRSAKKRLSKKMNLKNARELHGYLQSINS